MRHVLLVGAPGCGKTTVARRVIELLRARGAAVFGFWTGEIREAGVRQGFDIESLSGQREVMAHVGFTRGPAVSKYRVNLDAVKSVAVAEIQRSLRERQSGAILVMDEIGKMELFSAEFRAAVVRAFAAPLRILATAMAKPHPFVDGLKRRPDVELVTVTHANRERLPQLLAEQLIRD